MSRRGGLGAVRAIPRKLREPLVLDSATLFVTTLLMAAAGSVFWVVAARLYTSEAVGVAGSLISATVALAYMSQLGLNISLLNVLPHSERKSADVVASVVVVGATGLLLGWGYATVVAEVVPALAFLDASPAMPITFGVLVAGTAVNLLSDSLLLALRAVPVNLLINGVVMGAVRCGLPFALIGLGAFGLLSAVGISSCVAACLSVLVVLRRMPRPLRWRGTSVRLRRSWSLSGASYLATVVDMVPVLALPLVVLQMQGAASSGLYHVSFQIATLLYAIVHAVGQSMYAEGCRRPDQATRTIARAGMLMILVGGAAVLLVLPLSSRMLGIFGAEYATGATSTLRVFALGVFGVGLNVWSMVRLRIAQRLRDMLLTQILAVVVVVAAAYSFAERGLVWVAAAWSLGYLVGGLVGWLRMRRWSSHPSPSSASGGAQAATAGERR